MKRWLKPALCAALFLVVFGGRLWLIERCASDAPAWDQWDAIGQNLFQAHANRTLSAGDFFKPHNEHRILFTRLLSLGLLLANRQWDNRLETVADAALAALTAALFFGLLLRLGPPRLAVAFGLPVIGLAFILPFSWESTLFGFQSQFYFLILFSIAAMALLTLNAPGNWRWLAGWGLAVLCIWTMASGFLAACAVLALAVFEWLRNPRQWKAAALVVGAMAIIILAGWVLNVSVERHQGLRSHSVLQFLLAFGRNLAWPNLLWSARYYPWLAIICWIPFGALAWQSWRSAGAFSRLERLLLVLGFWVLLQMAALASARSEMSWRYMDILSLGLVVNGLAFGLLLARPAGLRFARLLIALGIIWGALNGWGLFTLTRQAVREEIPRKMIFAEVQQANLKAFLRGGDEQALAGKSSDEISFPVSSLTVLTDLLRDPFIRSILPPGLREPASPDAATGRPPAAGCLSRLARGLAHLGGALFLAGCAALGLIGWLFIRERRG